MESPIRDLTRHWGSDGEDYHFHYDLNKGETRVVDSFGREERYHWEHIVYTEHGALPLSITDRGGHTSTFSYDQRGNLLSESSDAGELGYLYDALGNLETLTLPDQRQLNHLYYGSGHLHQLNLNG